MTKNIFIVGSKGIPSEYGGFETFVDRLTRNRVSPDILYHVACISKHETEFYYNNARCFGVSVPNIGSAKAVLYDLKSLHEVISYIKSNKLENCIVYILACRVGPFLGYFKRQLEKLGAKLFVNPDGHEWKRGKWNKYIKAYWKFSERLTVKQADLLICDSMNIEKYIKEEYAEYTPLTTYIPYGADLKPSSIDDENGVLRGWYNRFGIKKNEYFLLVGRFVPENNYETIIKEFMKTKTQKQLVIISNVESNKLYSKLLESTHFDKDSRIKFVGTVYDEQLLKKIRENAFLYIHGHEVGGTNPSLLESMASTNVNLLLDVAFNREVACDNALYFSKQEGSLSCLINQVELESEETLEMLGKLAKDRIRASYSWKEIVNKYELLFMLDEVPSEDFSHINMENELISVD